MRSSHFVRVLVAGVGLSLFLSGVALAEGFRVDSQVFIGKETTPHCTNITLFHAAHVYDFLNQPRQITIYNLSRGRVVLVNPDRKLKAEVSQDMLETFCDNLRRAESQATDAVLRFSLDPHFDEQVGQSDAERVFSSKHITYKIKLLNQSSASMAGAYRKFSDASARLNAYVNRGSLPPFPRLLVNRSLATTGHVPAEVQLTVWPGRLGTGRTVALKSKHEYRGRLLDSDLRMIDDAGESLAQAALVPLTEFLRRAAPMEADGDSAR